MRHATSVAFTALTRAWATAATSRQPTTRLQAELDRANTEIALLNEELTIKNDRLDRVPPRRRPHYRPTDRMRILQLKAARGWSTEQTAKVFSVTEDAVATWRRRTDDDGDNALVQTSEPEKVRKTWAGILEAHDAAAAKHMKSYRAARSKKKAAEAFAAGLAALRRGFLQCSVVDSRVTDQRKKWRADAKAQKIGKKSRAAFDAVISKLDKSLETGREAFYSANKK